MKDGGIGDQREGNRDLIYVQVRTRAIFSYSRQSSITFLFVSNNKAFHL